MISPSSLFKKNEKSPGWEFYLVGLALFTGLILSILSWLEICVEHCSANQDYRLFGFSFALIGISFFIGLTLLHILSLHYSFLSRLLGWLIASSLGAEILFIIVQKYQIGHWCPICLSIAASIGCAALVLSYEFFKDMIKNIQEKNRYEMIEKIKQGFLCFLFILLGFLTAFFGISKLDPNEIALNEIKEKIAFASTNSPIEVYFVSDWFCPSCKKIEPLIETIYAKIQSKVSFYFIDYPIHKKSINFTPYNLSFLINDKSSYFKARQMLLELVDKTQAPTEEQIEELANKNGLTYKDLPFLDVKMGMEYFENIVKKYHLSSTPTIVVTNTHQNKVIILEGRDEITEEAVLKALAEVSNK